MRTTTAPHKAQNETECGTFDMCGGAGVHHTTVENSLKALCPVKIVTSRVRSNASRNRINISLSRRGNM